MREDTTAALDTLSPPETLPSPLKLVSFLFLSTVASPPPALPMSGPGGSVTGRIPGQGWAEVERGIGRESGRVEHEL